MSASLPPGKAAGNTGHHNPPVRPILPRGLRGSSASGGPRAQPGPVGLQGPQRALERLRAAPGPRRVLLGALRGDDEFLLGRGRGAVAVTAGVGAGELVGAGAKFL